VRCKVYVNGVLERSALNVPTGLVRAETTGSLQASIGGLFQQIRANTALKWPTSGVGWMKMSGSIDEVRYWKAERNAEEVGKYWFTQVNGGSNTDDANTDLGVYYKFNEGITGDTSIDSTALDYSGRVTNGAWVGYDSTYSRNTGSAIVSSSAAPLEKEDPIIYSSHSKVSDLLSEFKISGSAHDRENASSIYQSIPGWITEDDDTSLKSLTQIMSSYLDTLYLQIQHLPRIKDTNYVSGSDFKPVPFAGNLLDSCGFISPEIFVDADVFEEFFNRTDEFLFDDELHNVKNSIYQNIYNNLVHIYKSKGTEKAFRNLIRCYGIGDDIVKLNIYADNSTYVYQDNFEAITQKKNVINFNKTLNFNASVYQSTSSLDANSQSFISGAVNLQYIPRTIEANIFFPKKRKVHEKGYFRTSFVTSSLFGMHTSHTGPSSHIQWFTPDVANFQVYAIKDKEESPSVRFKLTGTAGGFMPSLTTDLFEGVYDNQAWNISVRVKPTKYPTSDFTNGSETTTYDVEFTGYNNILDITYNTFHLTGTMVEAYGKSFLSSSHRVYAGSHITNFTGTVLQSSDVRVGNVRYWVDYLEDEELKSHAKDLLNYGRKHPYQDAYPLIASTHRIRVPQKDTLALNWDFQQVTGSDASGLFLVDDYSSGSVSRANQMYGFLGPILLNKHPGLGYNFEASSTAVVDADYLHTARQTLPENVVSSDMTRISDDDDATFTRENRPVRHFFAFEKSMYDVISREMIDMFSTIKDFNNLIGNPVNRYRERYKDMEKLRSLFFDRVENTPDLDKYIDFYRWIDSSLGYMLNQLIPASADFADNMRNMIESHVLERNKYKTKFPTLEDKSSSPGYQMNFQAAVSEESSQDGFEMRYVSYEENHAPPPPDSNDQNTNPAYWRLSAPRDQGAASTGVASVDEARETIRKVVKGTFDRQVRAPGKVVTVFNRETGERFAKPIVKQKLLHAGVNYNEHKEDGYVDSTTRFGQIRELLSVGFDTLHSSSYTDSLTLNNENIKVSAKAITPADPSGIKAGLVTPFNLVQRNGSTPSGDYNDEVVNNFASNVIVTNLHSDGREIGLQGPFTQEHVGGKPYRHQPIATSPVPTGEERAESWRFDFGTSIAATAVDAIDTTGVAASAADCSFTITIPGSLGGDTTGGAGAITILLDADDPGVSPDNGPNQIGLGVQFFSDIDVAAIIIDAINNDVSSYPTRIAFASSGRGQTGVSGITAAEGSSNTQITLTMNTVGADGNISSAVADVSGVPVVDITDFTGGETNKKIIFSDPVGGALSSTRHFAYSKYYRDGRTKRPVNIRNIQYTSDSAVLGNYDKNYQVVSTTGRTANNLAYVQAAGVGFEQATPENQSLYQEDAISALDGKINFALPSRALENSSFTKTVFANHFNAPGGKDVSSRGVLNPSSEEYAAGNALPWRNRVVRKTLQDDLTVHTGHAGTHPYQQYGLKFPGPSVEIAAGALPHMRINSDSADALTKLGIATGAAMVSFSLSFWIRVSGPQARAPVTGYTVNALTVFAAASAAGARLFSVDVDGATGKVYIHDGTLTTTTDLGVDDNEWHHYVFIYTHGAPGAVAIYKDGVQLPGGPTTILFATPNRVTIGARWRGSLFGSTNYLDGDLDEVSIWSKALTGPEVATIYNSHHPGDLKKHSAKGDLEAWWRMGDDISVVHDSKGENHGQMAAAYGALATNLDGIVVTDVLRRQDSLATGSFQKTNRNPLWRNEHGRPSGWGNVTIKTVTYDNGYVTHATPRADTQYGWIRDSYQSTETYGHATGSSEITFVDIGEASAVQQLNTYSNNLVYTPIYSNKITLSEDSINEGYFEDGLLLAASSLPGQSPIDFPGALSDYQNVSLGAVPAAPADYFNILTTSRNGLAGVNTWKQIRNRQHPITRLLIQNNYYTYMEDQFVIGGIKSVASTAKGLLAYSWPHDISVKSVANHRQRTYFVEEPAVSFNQHPIVVDYRDPDGSYVSAFSFLNEMETFANDVLVARANMVIKKPKAYDTFLHAFKQNTKIDLNKIAMRDVIYPRTVNATLAKARGRLRYAETAAEQRAVDAGQSRLFWRDSLTDRLKCLPLPFTSFNTSLGVVSNYATISYTITAGLGTGLYIGASSIWPLDKNQRGASYKAGELAQDTRLSTGLDATYSTPGQQYALSGTHCIGMTQATNELLWSADTQSGKRPWFDSYEEYAQDIRGLGQSYTVVPEFKISDHMEYILNAGPDTVLNNFLSIEGAGTIDADLSVSAPSETSNYTANFFKTYVHSDFIKHFGDVKRDYEDLAKPSRMALQCNVVKKLLPYQGFYPVTRCMQLGTLFSSSHGDYLSGLSPLSSNQEKDYLAAITQPLFGPGILYNSIKAGFGYGWPIWTTQPTFYSALGWSPSAPFPTVSLWESGDDRTALSLINSAPNTQLRFEDLLLDGLPLNSNIYMIRRKLTGTIAPPPPTPSSTFYDNEYKQVAGKLRQLGDDSYARAMHNFLAEVGNTFLENEGVGTYKSQERINWKPMKSGQTYYMDVAIYKTTSMIQAEGPADISPISGSWTRGSMYGFMGVNESTVGARVDQDPRFAMFTPPGFYGNKEYVTIAYTADPLDELLSPPISKIAASASRIYALDQTDSTDYAPDPISAVQGILYDNRFTVTASLDLFSTSRAQNKTFDNEGNLLSASDPDGDKDDSNVWVINTKCEFPTLNFKDTGTSSEVRGMWGQYGRFPASNEGVYFAIQESAAYTKQTVPGAKSLVQVCGFDTTPRRIGDIASKKTISEALVAIPFTLIKSGKNKGKKRFININRTTLNRQVRNKAKTGYALPDEKILDTSITSMMSKMENYVMPPNLDFIRNKKVKPFVTYLFEFEHELDRQDLADIWQGLMPEISRTPELDKSCLAHNLDENEFFHGKELPNDLRWMVFKIKRRAKNNYYGAKRDSIDKGVRDEPIKNQREREFDYSYNWPHDFYSLVELAEVEAGVEFTATHPETGTEE
jgi:hypothetical protein